jgi:hypothetical protein
MHTIIAAAIIASAILGSRLIAPYQLAAAPGGDVYRVNAITGDVRQCNRSFAPTNFFEEAKQAGYSAQEILDYIGMPCR